MEIEPYKQVHVTLNFPRQTTPGSALCAKQTSSSREYLMEVVLSKILDSRTSASDFDDALWLKCLTSEGSIIIFWGSPENGKRNIDSLKSQNFPVCVSIESPEYCIPDSYVKRQYNASYSVPEHVWIQVNPEI